MSYFNTRAVPLFPSYALTPKKEKELDDFLGFLDKTGVGDLLISEDQNWNKSAGGRPSISKYSLFATILYAFTYDKASLRDISDRCEYDLRYMYLMDNQKVSFKTLGNFINHFILPNLDAIFACLNKALMKELDIGLEEIYIDGTKIEADANKYKFVWKPTTYHKNLCNKVRQLLAIIGLGDDLPKDEIFSSSIIADKLIKFGDIVGDDKIKIKQYESLFKYLEKALEYENKEEICGPDRGSYYKSDHDATAMTLKSDYYSGLGSNMHAAYNIQAVVAKGLIIERYVSQSRSDTSDFQKTVEKVNESYGVYPKAICADAGYGSYSNYRYLEEKGIKSYVKHQSWQGNVSGKSPDAYRVYDDDKVICLNDKEAYPIDIPNRHPKRAGGVFYRVDGCNSCPFKVYCKRWQKIKDEDFKIFEIDMLGSKLKRRSEENLLSVPGIIARVNRSIQAEGFFGSIKFDMGYDRFRRTSLAKVDLEFSLTALGYNFRKFFKHLDGEMVKIEWKPTKSLEPEQFKKPSAKRLQNKVLRKQEKTDNQKAKDRYKYKHQNTKKEGAKP